MQEDARRGMTMRYFGSVAAIALRELRYRDRPRNALRIVDQALARFPLADLDPLDRPYTTLAALFAEAGRLDEARRLMAEYEKTVPERYRIADPERYSARAAIALAERRPRDAIEAAQTRYRLGEQGFCGHCPLYELARAFDAAGMTDSARVVLERAVSSYASGRALTVEPFELPAAYQRLGELYEAAGDREKAVEYYDRFVELWRDADPELQPRVRDVRQRIARLVGNSR